MEVLNADLNNWALLFGAIMPFVVGIVTKRVASSGTKAVTLLFLNAVNGVLTDWFASPNGFDWEGAIFASLSAFITSVGLYYGLWKHTASPVVVDATARFGIGPSPNGAGPKRMDSAA